MVERESTEMMTPPLNLKACERTRSPFWGGAPLSTRARAPSLFFQKRESPIASLQAPASECQRGRTLGELHVLVVVRAYTPAAAAAAAGVCARARFFPSWNGPERDRRALALFSFERRALFASLLFHRTRTCFFRPCLFFQAYVAAAYDVLSHTRAREREPLRDRFRRARAQTRVPTGPFSRPPDAHSRPRFRGRSRDDDIGYILFRRVQRNKKNFPTALFPRESRARFSIFRAFWGGNSKSPQTALIRESSEDSTALSARRIRRQSSRARTRRRPRPAPKRTAHHRDPLRARPPHRPAH